MQAGSRSGKGTHPWKLRLSFFAWEIMPGVPARRVTAEKEEKEAMCMIIKTQDNPRLISGMFIFENSEGIITGGTAGETVCILTGSDQYTLGVYDSRERIEQIREQIAESFTRNEKIFQMPAK